MFKKCLSKKTKRIIAITIATLTIIPIVSVSAVACYNSKPANIITIKTQPENQTAIAGQTENLPKFFINVNEIRGASLTYQWYSNTKNSTVDGTIINTATTNSYAVTGENVKKAGTIYFYVEVGGTINGVKLPVVKSALATLKVTEKQKSLSKIIYTNQTKNLPIFSVSATTKHPDEKLTYQWYFNASNSTKNGQIINGATKNSYKVTALDVGSSPMTKYFYVVVGGEINGVKLTPVFSNPMSLIIKQIPTININSKLIDQTVILNQTKNLPVFLINAITDSDDKNIELTYQWYSNMTNSNTNGQMIAGATKSSYQITTSDIGLSPTTKYFYVVVEGEINGLTLKMVISNVGSLTIKSL